VFDLNSSQAKTTLGHPAKVQAKFPAATIHSGKEVKKYGTTTAIGISSYNDQRQAKNQNLTAIGASSMHFIQSCPFHALPH
jgi:hypothetical protein